MLSSTQESAVHICWNKHLLGLQGEFPARDVSQCKVEGSFEFFGIAQVGLMCHANNFQTLFRPDSTTHLRLRSHVCIILYTWLLAEDLVE